jgi:homoserine/homoserine lactone efflux protein
MDLSVWVAYFITTIVLSLSPGPGVFSSISSGLHHGFRLGLWNGIGMQVANLLMVIVVALGLGTIVLASETLFTAVKWLGVIYLVYLGIVTWRAAPRTFEEDRDDNAHTACEVFMRGFWVNATNPKGIVIMEGYTALAAKVLRVMRDPRHLRWVNRGIGGAFVAAGVALASFRRAA